MGTFARRLRSTSALKPLLKRIRPAADWAVATLGLTQSDERLARDAQSFWGDSPDAEMEFFQHWRGAGLFADDARWLRIGGENLAIYQQFARALSFPTPAARVVDWGCGGGANAVHFAKGAEAYYGVDISQAALKECAKQMAAEGLANFHPVHIDANAPETAADAIGHPVDLFYCMYVFEALPSPQYGERLLRLAHRLLRPGGMAFIQIKYQTADRRTRSKGYAYTLNMASMTTWRIEDFWHAASTCGFEPKLCTLVPWSDVVDDERYAYFALLKPTGGQSR